jgi:hypothetical protein
MMKANGKADDGVETEFRGPNTMAEVRLTTLDPYGHDDVVGEGDDFAERRADIGRQRPNQCVTFEINSRNSEPIASTGKN